jgi:hypothetical protein
MNMGNTLLIECLGTCLICKVVNPVGPGAFCLNVLTVIVSSFHVIGGQLMLVNRAMFPVPCGII